MDAPGSAHHRHQHHALYGVMAEFDTPTDLVAAARRTYEAGYRRINGYSPYPIEELSEAIGFTHTSLPLIVFIGGVVGGLSGFFMQYWMEKPPSPPRMPPIKTIKGKYVWVKPIASDSSSMGYGEYPLMRR